MDQHYLSSREDGTFKSALEIPLFLPRNRHECIDFSLRLKMGGLSLEARSNGGNQHRPCDFKAHCNSHPRVLSPWGVSGAMLSTYAPGSVAQKKGDRHVRT